MPWSILLEACAVAGVTEVVAAVGGGVVAWCCSMSYVALLLFVLKLTCRTRLPSV